MAVVLSGRSRWCLVLLACAAFTYNTSESLPVGLLPQMASNLGVSDSDIGALLTLYAVVVAVTVIPLVVLLSRVGRRRLVLVSVGVLVLSNLAMTFAPDYGFLLLARLLSATTHGIFWSIVAPTAAMLVPKGREGFATSMAFMGSSLALVLGTPVMTAVGTLLGWRAATALLGVLGALAFVGLFAILPRLEVEQKAERLEVGIRRQLWASLVATLRNRSLLILCGATIVLVVAYFAIYTYIALFIQQNTGLAGTGLAVVLLGFGAAGVSGVWITGRVTDRHPRSAALWCTAALGVAFLGIGVFAGWAPGFVIGSVVLLGAAFAATPVFLQAAVLRVAPDTGDIASSIYVVAFQIGIAGGSFLGGVAVGQSAMGVLPWIAALVTVGGIAILWAARGAFVGPSRGSRASATDSADACTPGHSRTD